MESRARIPQLAYPFAVVGAAAGWLSASFLGNPIVGLAVPGEERYATVAAGAVGALVGAALTRFCVVHLPWLQARALWVRLASAVLTGGTVAGALVGAASFGSALGIGSAAVHGFFSAIAFVPVCALVLAAARRAERARLGSIVAGVDRRAVWAILAAALAVATLAALPGWPASRPEVASSPIDPLRARPWPALAMALAALAVTVVFAILDVAALLRVRKAAGAPDLQERDEAALDGRERAARLDLGLGAGLAAVVAPSPSAYRGRERAVSLLLGSVPEARRAIRWALARALFSAAVIGLVLFAHRLAYGPTGTIAYELHRCEKGYLRSCSLAADAMIAAHPEESVGAVLELRRRGCDAMDARSCAQAASMLESASSGSAWPPEARALRARGCDAGGARSCGVLAAHLRNEHDEAAAASLFRRACAWGDAPSCASIEPPPAAPK